MRDRVRLFFYFALVLTFGLSWGIMIRMPGRSYRGTPPVLSADELQLRDELKREVEKLAGGIGERNYINYAALETAANYLEQQLAYTHLKVRRESYEIDGKSYHNIEAELAGNSRVIVLVGAHYDSVLGSPGANDNASGVAAMLALGRRFAATHNALTLRFVAFVNEEPPYFQTPQMGSYVYAARCRERGERIAAMLSLETIGYYSELAGSQRYPMPALNLLYPKTGNFIGFVGNVASRSLLRDAIGKFREVAQIGSEGGALPEIVPGIGWSDQWAFWRNNYPAIMVTDSAPFRYPYYHSRADTPEKLSYDPMTRVVAGLQRVVGYLANKPAR